MGQIRWISMASIKVYNADGEVVEEIEVELDDSLAERGNDVLAMSLIRQTANARKPYAHTKTRSEVRGGGGKPWRQKGVGRARHGSRRSPIWVGGGKAFGPDAARNFAISMNKKERRLAMRKAVYNAVIAGKVALLQGLEFSEPSTRRGIKLLNDIGLDGKVLFVHSYTEKALLKSFSNLRDVTMYDAHRLNVHDLMAFDHILCVREEFDKIRERWID
jgi:large subunit ribosomal protein L4